MADLDGNGRKEICVITSRGFLIVLTDRCKKVWAQRLPSDPLTVAALPAQNGPPGCVAVGCREGLLVKLDAKGNFTGQAEQGDVPVRMVRLDDRRVVVAGEKGAVAAYEVR